MFTTLLDVLPKLSLSLLFRELVMSSRVCLALVLGVLLQACAYRGEPQRTEALVLGAPLQDWRSHELPGKPQTRYSLDERGGRRCVLARAERSASLLRRTMAVAPQQLGTVQFDWWIERFEPGAGARDGEADDAVARLVLAFDGDHGRLSLGNRMKFELAQAMTGELPPYATLMYVWDEKAEPGTVITNRHTDRIRKLVVGSGKPVRRGWLHFRRNIATDFERAFGEAPGMLVGVALMTDADNIRGYAQACYGDLLFLDASAAAQPLPGSLRF